MQILLSYVKVSQQKNQNLKNDLLIGPLLWLLTYCPIASGFCKQAVSHDESQTLNGPCLSLWEHELKKKHHCMYNVQVIVDLLPESLVLN